MAKKEEKLLEDADQSNVIVDTDIEDVTKLHEETDFTSDKTVMSDNTSESKVASIEEKYEILNDKYLRQAAEFDNYRKRTIREKSEILKSGGAATLTALLPVIDDFERALNTLKNADDVVAIVEGINLIYDKFITYLSQQGVKAINAVGQPFDTEHFEAVAMLPAPSEDMKGKILDCIQTGYMLYDKVIRHAKVVVGE